MLLKIVTEARRDSQPPVPLLTVWHGGSRWLWPLINLRGAERDAGNGESVVFEGGSTSVPCVERDRASHVSDLISHTVHALDERVPRAVLLLGCFRRFSGNRHLFFSSC